MRWSKLYLHARSLACSLAHSLLTANTQCELLVDELLMPRSRQTTISIINLYEVALFYLSLLNRMATKILLANLWQLTRQITSDVNMRGGGCLFSICFNEAEQNMSFDVMHHPPFLLDLFVQSLFCVRCTVFGVVRK